MLKPTTVRSMRVKVNRETEKALLVSNGAGMEVWLPKSQLHDLERDANVAEFNIDQWLFEEKCMDGPFDKCVVSEATDYEENGYD